MTRRSVPTAFLAVVAALAVFGIGVLAGREITRPPPTSVREAAAVYDLSAAAAIPPALLTYRLALSIPVGLREPRGIASIQDGGVYVCGDQELVLLGRGGEVRGRWELGGEPTCVTASGGRAYVGVRDHLEVVEPAGELTVWPDLGSQAIVTSVAAVGDAVFVADAGNRMLLRFSSAGALAGAVARDFTVPSPFFDVAGAPDGSIYAADPGAQRVRHYSASGKLLGAWGTSSLKAEGFAGCCNPAHIAVLPCGALVTAEKGLPRVKVYEPDGRLTAVVAAPADFRATESGLDLATRKANGGEILVLVPLERVVRVYVKAG